MSEDNGWIFDVIVGALVMATFIKVSDLKTELSTATNEIGAKTSIQKILTTPRQCLLDDTERYSRLAEVPEGTIAVEFQEYPLPIYFMACRPLEGE